MIVYTWYFGTISGAYCIPMLVLKQIEYSIWPFFKGRLTNLNFASEDNLKVFYGSVNLTIFLQQIEYSIWPFFKGRLTNLKFSSEDDVIFEDSLRFNQKRGKIQLKKEAKFNSKRGWNSTQEKRWDFWGEILVKKGRNSIWALKFAILKPLSNKNTKVW